MSEYTEEKKTWELAEKIFVQYHSNRLSVRISETVKAAYESAKEFRAIQEAALEKKLNEKSSSKGLTKIA